MSGRQKHEQRDVLESGLTFDVSPVVDCDVHPTFTTPAMQEKMAAYMDEPYASILLNDEAYPANGWPRTMGGRYHEHFKAEDPEIDIQQNLCEANGIDYPILNILSPLDSLKGDERALQEMRAVNNLLLDHFLDDHDNFYGLCSVAARKPHKAAEEIDRLGNEKQIKGVLFVPGGEYQKPLGDPEHDIIYQAIEDNNLAAVYHGGDGGIVRRSAQVLNDLQTLLSVHTLGFPWSLMLALTSLIVQGVPEKFPDINFVMLEAGISWVPYMMGRLNSECSWRSMDAPLLERSPEDYIRDQFYFGTQPMEEFNNLQDIDKILDVVGPDSIIFSSDWPHWDFDNPETTDSVLRSAFTSEEREQILSQNAIDAFNLDL